MAPLDFSPYPEVYTDTVTPTYPLNNVQCPACSPEHTLTSKHTRHSLTYTLVNHPNQPTGTGKGLTTCDKYGCLKCRAEWYQLTLPKCTQCKYHYTLSQDKQGAYIVDLSSCMCVPTASSPLEWVQAISYADNPTHVIFPVTKTPPPPPPPVRSAMESAEDKKDQKDTTPSCWSWLRNLFCCKPLYKPVVYT